MGTGKAGAECNYPICMTRTGTMKYRLTETADNMRLAQHGLLKKFYTLIQLTGFSYRLMFFKCPY